MRIYYRNLGNSKAGNAHWFTNGLQGDKRIDCTLFENSDPAWAIKRFKERYNLWDAEIIDLNRTMKDDTYYLIDNKGNVLHRSGAFATLLNYTAETKDTTIWYNNHIVWVQNPEKYEEE